MHLYVHLSMYICVHTYIDAFVCTPMNAFELTHIYGHTEGKRDGSTCNILKLFELSLTANIANISLI